MFSKKGAQLFNTCLCAQRNYTQIVAKRFSSSRSNNSLLNNIKKAPATTATAKNTSTTAKGIEINNSETKEDTVKDSKTIIQATSDSKTKDKDNAESSKHNKQIVDYSWLPKAPKLKPFSARELKVQSLYSGYRPLFLNYKNSALGNEKKENQFLVDINSLDDLKNLNIEFSLLDDEDSPSIWSYSATELEYDPVWESVPNKVLEQLRPYSMKFDPKELLPKKKALKNNKSVDGNKHENKGVFTKGRKRYLPERYVKTMKTRQDKKIELKRLLQNKKKIVS